MFRAGSLSVTECPSRLLNDDPEADELLSWWMESSPWDGMSGAPAGPPEWPEPGGYWHQPARLVHAVSILREEYGRLRSGAGDGKDKGKK